MRRRVIKPPIRKDKSIINPRGSCCKGCKDYLYSTANLKILADRLADSWGRGSENKPNTGNCICYNEKFNESKKSKFLKLLKNHHIHAEISECGGKTKVLFVSNDIKLGSPINEETPTNTSKNEKASKRQISGRNAKLGGHKFEEILAEHLGLPLTTVDGGSGTKVDINASEEYGLKISVKNPSGRNTQVYLPTQASFGSFLGAGKAIRDFISLFFGCDSKTQYEDLIAEYEIDTSMIETELKDKMRVPSSVLPQKMQSAAIEFLNSHSMKVLRACFVANPNEPEAVDTLGWAWTKDDPSSVDFYDIGCLMKRASQGSWVFSDGGTVLNFLVGEDKVLHLQRKGSGRSNANSPQFHMYDSLLVEECLVKLSRLDGSDSSEK